MMKDAIGYINDTKYATDYYPFGMGMPNRCWSSGDYRFGFNGKENDNEVEGQGKWQDYGMRMYDLRLCRFVSNDPIQIKYPELSPYQFASNSSIGSLDIDGLERVSYNYISNNKTGKPVLEGFKVDKYDINGKLLPFSRHATLNGNPTTFDEIYNGPSFKSKVINVIKKIDEGGSYDGANAGGLSMEDTKQGLKVMGLMTGVGSIIEGAVAVGVLSLGKSINELGANEKGETLLQQNTKGDMNKAVKIIENVTDVLLLSKGVSEIVSNPENVINASGVVIDVLQLIDKNYPKPNAPKPAKSN